jgi:L-arabonate dehydrase
MEDFCYAGGLPVVMKEIQHLLHRDIVTASGKTVGENIADAENYDPRRHQDHGRAFQGEGRHRRAARQPGAARRRHQAQRRHPGADGAHRPRRGVRGSNDFHARIDDDNLDVDETCILVLKNCGPKGYPGMAEVGNMPLPPKVLRKASPTWCASATPA